MSKKTYMAPLAGIRRYSQTRLKALLALAAEQLSSTRRSWVATSVFALVVNYGKPAKHDDLNFREQGVAIATKHSGLRIL